jgi:hypothetical protein
VLGSLLSHLRGDRRPWADVVHHGLLLLHSRAADLCAHTALHLARRHLDLRCESARHGVCDGGGRSWRNASITLQLTSRHAGRCARILRKLVLHRVLVISVRACWACSSSCCHGCRLGWRHTVWLMHAGHVPLLRITHLLMVLWVWGASLAVPLRGKDRRCLLVRMHLLLLGWGGDGWIPGSGILCSTVRLDVPRSVSMVRLLVLRVVGHVDGVWSPSWEYRSGLDKVI